MSGAWPWLAVAGIGALHGLNPTTGWAFAAAWGVKTGDRKQALRALVPIAAGHLSSIALVATAVAGSVAVGRAVDLSGVQAFATPMLVLLLVLGTVHCLTTKTTARSQCAVGHIGLAVWSFVMSTAQGAGLMLVPALVPICMGDSALREITASGSFWLALLAVAVHTTAMLAVSGLIAIGTCRCFGWVAACFHSQHGRRKNPPHPNRRSKATLTGRID
jgi:hypothetical protein